jgi:hypothetical protein
MEDGTSLPGGTWQTLTLTGPLPLPSFAFWLPALAALTATTNENPSAKQKMAIVPREEKSP